MEEWYDCDGFQLHWPYELIAISNLNIERQFNEHTRCTFTAVMSETAAAFCLRKGRYQDSISIRKLDDKGTQYWFAGGITNIDIAIEDGISHVKIEAISRSYSMDITPKSRSYQNKNLTYSKLIHTLVEEYPNGDAQNEATQPGEQIGELIIQYQETDWQFMKRLASRIGTVILPDVMLDAPRIYFGVPDFSWGREMKAKSYTMYQDHLSYLDYTYNATEANAAKILESDWIRYRVVSQQYFQVGENVGFKHQIWVIHQSNIRYEKGELLYEYILIKRKSLRRKLKRNQLIQGIALEGRVVERANNMVKVHLDIDRDHDDQGNWWFPYSPEGNNIFHCMPEVNAKIKVYFPDGIEKKAMAINSARGASEDMKSRTVFENPKTKVFHIPAAAKMELGEEGILFEKDTVSISLEESNIIVNATEDIILAGVNKIQMGYDKECETYLDVIQMKAKNFIGIQANEKQLILVNEGFVAIQSQQTLFEKVEVNFLDMLTEVELRELYIDELASQEFDKLFAEEALKSHNARLLASSKGVDVLTENIEKYQMPQVREEIRRRVDSEPALKNKAKSSLEKLEAHEQVRKYEQKYLMQSAGKEETKEEKAQDKRNYIQQYLAYDAVRKERYVPLTFAETMEEKPKPILPKELEIKWSPEANRSSSKTIAPQNLTSIDEINLINPLLNSTPNSELFVNKFEQFQQFQRDTFGELGLDYFVPNDPDYLSKKNVELIYYSRYTYKKLLKDPALQQVELSLLLNVVFGVVALAAAIPTMGSSVYVTAAVMLGTTYDLGQIYISYEKYKDIQSGDLTSNPTLMGLDQGDMDKIGFVLMAVNLAMIGRQGVKALDKSIDTIRMKAATRAMNASDSVTSQFNNYKGSLQEFLESSKGSASKGTGDGEKLLEIQRLQEALRSRILGYNHEQGKFSYNETLGISRAEKALNKKFQPSDTLGVDMKDPGGLGDVSLKGPFLNNNRQPLTSAQQEAVIKNLTKHINNNMAVDAHIIDTLGLDAKVISALKEALKNSRVKIIYLE